MPQYRYKAITEDGCVITGKSFSNTREELAGDLTARGLFVTKISRNLFPSLTRTPRLEALLFFLKEFTVLLRSGLSVPDSLQITSKERGAQLGGILAQIHFDILSGKRLTQAFSKLAETFDPLLLSVVGTGEKSGELVDSLQNYQSLLVRRIELRRKLRHAMMYPLFILLIVVVILIVIFQFSLPRFVELYADLDAELPAATGLLLYVSENFSYIAAALSLLFITAWQGWQQMRSRSWLVYGVDRYSLKLPVIGIIRRAYIISLFARTLSSLLASGAPLVEAIQHTARALPSRYFTERLAGVSQLIAKGASLTAAITGTELLPTAAEKIIEAGERSGSLEEQLLELAEFYESDIDYQLGLALSLVEPLLILITGIIVGGIVVVMYLPIFSLAGAIS
jgi:type IV pilus assembly protein PilC